MPILFPPNRTEGGRFEFKGEPYFLEINEPLKNNHIHGNMYDAPFSIVDKNSTQLKCFYENKEERYPFPFRMTIIYTLGGNGLFQSIHIQNISLNHAMPVLFGLHTTFLEPVEFSVPIGKRWETNKNYIPTGRLLDLGEHEQSFISGCNPNGKKISGFYTSIGHTAVVGDYFYQVSKNFSQWILFNNNGDKGFLCIEPQSGPVNGLKMENGYIHLNAGESISFWNSISYKQIISC